MEKPAKKKAQKPVVFKADSPYTSPKWPRINPTEQENMLNLLCHLLSPIGHHRKIHTSPSKGKRSKKRKRKDENAAAQVAKEASGSMETKAEVSAPPIPEIQHHITVGLNSTSRYLESMVNPPTLEETESPSDGTPKEPTIQPKPLATIFLTAASTNYLPYSHLPTLTSLASAIYPNALPIRLVQLSAVSETQLCEALGIPRVGAIGVLEEAPGAKPLIEYVRDTVEAVDVPWAKEVGAGRWLGTKILDGTEGKGRGS